MAARNEYFRPESSPQEKRRNRRVSRRDPAKKKLIGNLKAELDRLEDEWYTLQRSSEFRESAVYAQADVKKKMDSIRKQFDIETAKYHKEQNAKKEEEEGREILEDLNRQIKEIDDDIQKTREKRDKAWVKGKYTNEIVKLEKAKKRIEEDIIELKEDIPELKGGSRKNSRKSKGLKKRSTRRK